MRKAVVIALAVIFAGIVIALDIIALHDPYFFTKEPQVSLPNGTYYQGQNYLELEQDSTYSLYEEVSGNLSFENPYYKGPYIVEKGFVYLKVNVTDNGLWTGRKFQIINRTTLKDELQEARGVESLWTSKQ